MQQFIDKATDWITSSGISVISGLIILVVGLIVAGMLKRGIVRLLNVRKLDPTLVNFCANLLYGFMVVAVVTASLNKFGIQTTSVIAVIGAAGLAVGLALQSSLSNFASGVMLLIFRPFTVGDFIEAAGVSASVDEISLFTTRLLTPDNKVIFVPNGNITGGNIVNYTRQDTRRVDLVVGVGYGDDVRKVKEVLERILADEPRILKDPAPVVAVLELADSSVNFAVRPWVRSSDYWNVYFSLQEAFKLRLDEEGIEIPFPQRDVHMHTVAQAAGAV